VVGPVEYKVEATGENAGTAATDREVEAAGEDVAAEEGGRGMTGGSSSSLRVCL
jgi:hypothetical protein